MGMESLSLAGVLFAADNDLLGIPMPIIAVVVLLVLFMTANLMLLVKYYKRCPSNRIMVIYGKTPSGEPITINGGARFVLPLLQDYAWLSLEPIRLEVSSPERPSGEGLDFPVPRFFTVAIGTTHELMQNAAARLLGLSYDRISQLADDIITAQLSKLIDSMVVERATNDQEAFYSQLERALAEELEQLGMVLISYRRE